ncbi:malic enzyme [Colletotrichum asianum]|uniref:Malic enzyme n=1 Tax=Colletotrichum asianum TaxID=702518 RepID=A0A8H3ZW27_9PEZI|nr:malic enzyme [Colletotrichum asianum]
MTDFNPMSSVDINAIEEKMRMASLDQHRGYAQNTFGEVQQYRNNEPLPRSQAVGYQVLKEPLWNKGQWAIFPSHHTSTYTVMHGSFNIPLTARTEPTASAHLHLTAPHWLPQHAVSLHSALLLYIAAPFIYPSHFLPLFLLPFTPSQQLPRMASSLSGRSCRLPISSLQYLKPRRPLLNPRISSSSIHNSSKLTAMVESGLAFTPEERINKNLTGLIPHTMESLQTQCARAMKMINTRSTPVDKYLYLSSLKAQNFDLFYRLLMDNIRDLMPLVYTPTIGDVCLQYSTLYTRPEALYISIKQRKSIRTMLRNWPYPNPEICVVTDGSRILGLGDLGVNGVGISIGKLALYTGAAGIHPENTLPIVLDTGTNNENNLKDPFYLGIRSKRVSVAEQQAFMDEFMEAVAEVYPNMTVQFEDFESEKAFNYLDRYRNKYRCFNDDIQGTGAVVLAGYINAVELSGVPLEEQRLVFMGAGSAGVGVAKQLVEYYTKRGLSEQAAKDKFWLVDTKGLVTKDRGDKLAEHKKYFARTDNNGHQFRTLEEVIAYVKPSALVGLTATFGVFTESVVRALKASVDAGGLGRRPVLFPLSNPLTKAECTFEQAIQWTDGTVLFASGSPFNPVTVKSKEGESITYHPNQGNNVYVFPGLGLGAILAKATKVTDDMVYTSAASLAASLNADEIHKGLIYPRIERVRDASLIVAREVMKAARRAGVSQLPESQWVEWEEWGDVALNAWIKERVYDPVSFERSRI